MGVWNLRGGGSLSRRSSRVSGLLLGSELTTLDSVMTGRPPRAAAAPAGIRRSAECQGGPVGPGCQARDPGRSSSVASSRITSSRSASAFPCRGEESVPPARNCRTSRRAQSSAIRRASRSSPGRTFKLTAQRPFTTRTEREATNRSGRPRGNFVSTASNTDIHPQCPRRAVNESADRPAIQGRTVDARPPNGWVRSTSTRPSLFCQRRSFCRESPPLRGRRIRRFGGRVRRPPCAPK